MPRLKPSPLPPFATFAHRIVVATCVASTSLLATGSSYGQTGPVPGASTSVAGNAAQYPPPIDPQSVSCSALKARLQASGELTILSGPRGAWGDTFYGPVAPRCQFWQMPRFSYVRTTDGLCGIGYICVEKLSHD